MWRLQRRLQLVTVRLEKKKSRAPPRHVYAMQCMLRERCPLPTNPVQTAYIYLANTSFVPRRSETAQVDDTLATIPRPSPGNMAAALPLRASCWSPLPAIAPARRIRSAPPIRGVMHGWGAPVRMKARPRRMFLPHCQKQKQQGAGDQYPEPQDEGGEPDAPDAVCMTCSNSQYFQEIHHAIMLYLSAGLVASGGRGKALTRGAKQAPRRD